MATTPDIISDVAVKRVPLSREQRGWLEQTVSRIDEERMRAFNCAITSIHSPTGEERAASEWMTQQMLRLGIDAFYQPLDERSGHAVGQLKGAGGGPSLLLYAPIDTHLRADPHEDVPWVGSELRPDMLPHGAIADNGDVLGLGSANPKGMITALTEAVHCIRSAGVPLKGDILLAFAGGGMPSMPPPGETRQNHGLSSGVIYMLNHGITADFAIICKPGWAAAWEEVGLCWFQVTVRGQMGYAGMTRSFPNFRNAIVHAATFILALEEWLPGYQARNTSGLCSPQGAIAAIRGGWPHKPAFPTAATEVYIDLRCNPRTSPAAVKAQFAEAITAICAQHPELTLDWNMYAAYPVPTLIQRTGSCNPPCVVGSSSKAQRITPSLVQVDKLTIRAPQCRHSHGTPRLSARTDDSSRVAGFWRARCQPYSQSRESNARHSLCHHRHLYQGSF